MKKQQQEKPGKVIRVDPLIWKFVSHERRARETVSAALRRLLGLPSRKGEAVQKFYVLPSDLTDDLAKARGRAVIEAARKKSKAPEKPIAVRLEA